MVSASERTTGLTSESIFPDPREPDASMPGAADFAVRAAPSSRPP